MKFINLFMYAKFPILCMSRNVGKNTNNWRTSELNGRMFPMLITDLKGILPSFRILIKCQLWVIVEEHELYS